MNFFQKIIIPISVFFVSTFQILLAQTANRIDWKEDLKIYKESLEQKHIDLYHSVSKETFLTEWSKIYNNVESLNDFDIILKLMRLTRQINDGHTAVSLRNMTTHQFPLEVEYIDNQWRVVKVNNKNNNLLKLSLVAIDNVPIKEVSAKVSEVAQFVENQFSQIIRTGNYLTISELLFALNVTKKKNEAVFTFLDANNKKIKTTLKALDVNSLNKTSDFVYLTIGVPEITKPNNPSFPYLWFSPIKNTQAIYINFESYPTFEDMQIFGETLVNYILKNQINQVVIDMRNNGGGDLYVGTVLAYALNLADSIDWKNGVFVLTSNKTFSAATSNTALFKHLLNAKTVGQPTGSNPNGYQDMDQFELPNSKLIITYSKRKFNLSETVTNGIKPDVLLIDNWSDYKLGIDNILQWVIKDLKVK
ncbi:S41 family peptidase [Lutibacter maritimus]|uniref:Peptidase family S41 n=1 Tax=Lutibacter maritimus TaxID=593133 RepID=A0A1I6QFH7_9FLAO|nr:S41 family peptidase [Lutibacter maritimus]SFS51194.1 Peptidase family S41 [Lutibacter maritimus]